MLKHGTCLMVLLLSVSAVWAAGEAGSAEDDPRWTRAQKLENGERYLDAAAVYHAIFKEYPASQRTILQAAICEHKGKEYATALSDYRQAIDMEPYSYWAEVGICEEAHLLSDMGGKGSPDDLIQTMNSRFPESRWIAKVAVLQAELNGEDTAAAEATLARELEAHEAFRAANAGKAATDGMRRAVGKGPVSDEDRLLLLEDVLATYPETHTALGVMSACAHMHIKLGDRETAVEKFLDIIQCVEADAPQSRLVETAHERLGGLYHAMGEKAKALDSFSRLAQHAQDRRIVANATLQAAGLYFELRQAELWEGMRPDFREWEEIRSMCNAVRELGFATEQQLARADLMIMESYLWEKRPEECLDLARTYLSGHSYPEYRRELATAHLFAGESLQRLGLHDEALTHYRWIADEQESGGEVWPYDYLITRVYYRIFDALGRSGAEDSVVVAAGDEVLSRYPDSTGAELVRRWMANNGQEGTKGEVNVTTIKLN